MENKKLNPSREDNIYRLFESVIPDFHKAKKGMNNWMVAKCPLHKDKRPSFSFNLNGGWHCFAGCGKGDASTLAEKLGLDPKPYYKYVIGNSNHGFTPIVVREPKTVKVIPIEPEYISLEDVNNFLDPKQYQYNKYALFLKDTLGAESTNELLYNQYIGTWQQLGKFKGASVFFYIDQFSKVCSYKVIQYNDNGERIKKPKSLIMANRPDNFKRCFYNEHLIKLSGNKIAIVESEKTANLMTYYRPDCIWLATGGESNLNEALFSPLKGRNITLYPDQGSYENWSEIANSNSLRKFDIGVSKDCEIWFNKNEIKEKQDIADYYLNNHNLRWDIEWNQAEYDSIFSFHFTNHRLLD